jgi:arylsulfatase A-like enzyme
VYSGENNPVSRQTAGPVAEYLAIEEETVEVVHPAITLDRSLALGAAWGVVAWSAYGLVEFVLCAIWPLFTTNQAVFTPLNWKLTSWLFNSYWVLGATSGGLLGMLARRLPASENRSRLAGAFGLYFALLMHLLTGTSLDKNSGAVLILDSLLCAATAWSLLRPDSRLANWTMPSPLLAALLILGPTWISADVIGVGVWRRRSGAVLLTVTLFAAARWLNRFRAWSPTPHLAVNLAALGLVIAASAALSGMNRSLPPSPRAPASDPGTTPVILVTFDTTRADHLSAYGYSRKTTPYLEEFARGATLYTNSVSASDMTLSSHGSMFTGLYPSWHGAHVYSANPVTIHPLDLSVPTLAGVLASRGVFTAAVAANNAFLTREWGLARGFQSFDVQTPVQVLSFERTHYLRHGIRRLLSCCLNTLPFDALYRGAAEVNNDVIGIMEDRAVRKRSFFLFVNYMDAHTPYVAPLAGGSTLPDGHGAPDLPEYRELTLKLLRDGRPFPPVARERMIERYDAGIAAEDAAFRELTGWLKRRDLYDRAMIIVTADHGEAFGEHGLSGHGVGTYQHQSHVPLLIKYPRQTAGAVVTAPVSHVDLLPTIFDTLGIPFPAEVHGRSLRNPEALAGRAVYTESFPAKVTPTLIVSLDRVQRAIRQGSLKLIVASSGTRQLFDLSRDPEEQHNLIAIAPTEGERLDAAMREWIRLMPDTTARPVQNEQQMRLLKGLGYVH